MSPRIAESREGFEVETDSYEVPTNLRKLDGESLLAVSICDMFVNRGSTISMIMEAEYDRCSGGHNPH